MRLRQLDFVRECCLVLHSCVALWATLTAVPVCHACCAHRPHVLLCRTCAWSAYVAQMAGSWQRLRPPFDPCTWRAWLWHLVGGWCMCSPGSCQIVQLVCYSHVACAFCCCGCSAPHSLVINSMIEYHCGCCQAVNSCCHQLRPWQSVSPANRMINACRSVQGPMMRDVRRLTRLTTLSMAGFPNLAGDAPIVALATSLPPDLAALELEAVGERPNEVQHTGCKSFCRGREHCPWLHRLHVLHQHMVCIDPGPDCVTAIEPWRWSCWEAALARCAASQGCACHGGLSDVVLVFLASPLLGPCKVQQLNLTNQQNITGRGIAALAGGRLPGGFSCALSDAFAVLCDTSVHTSSV